MGVPYRTMGKGFLQEYNIARRFLRIRSEGYLQENGEELPTGPWVS